MSEIQAVDTNSRTGQDRPDRILLCCADLKKRRNLTEILSGAGYSVTETDTVSAGITSLHHFHYAAIIMDIDMAPVNGIAFRTMIRSFDKTTPILFLIRKCLTTPIMQLDELSIDPKSYFIPKWPEPFLMLKKLEQILAASKSEENLLEARKNLHRKLMLACSLQTTMLPPMMVENDVMEYSCLYRPKMIVSNELFERLSVSDTEVTFIHGSVAGKGIYALLAKAALQAFFKNLDRSIRNSPHAIAEALNQCLFDH